MGKHYKTKMNSSFLYNNLPKTFIRFLKHTKQLRSFIKYVNENNNFSRTTSILKKYLYDNEYDTTYSLLNTLIKQNVYYNKLLDEYRRYMEKYEYDIYITRGRYIRTKSDLDNFGKPRRVITNNSYEMYNIINQIHNQYEKNN